MLHELFIHSPGVAAESSPNAKQIMGPSSLGVTASLSLPSPPGATEGVRGPQQSWLSSIFVSFAGGGVGGGVVPLAALQVSGF